jgi:small subunit ribosomal protein S17
MVTETKKKSEKPAKAAKAPVVAKSAATPAEEGTNALQRRKVVVGTVVSNKMQKTIVVVVDHRVRHSDYAKYVVRSTRFKAHDEKNDARIGDRVSLVESRPLSRDKRWVLQSIIRRANQVAEANV